MVNGFMALVSTYLVPSIYYPNSGHTLIYLPNSLKQGILFYDSYLSMRSEGYFYNSPH